MTTMGTLPEVVSREEWLAVRKKLLIKEKELTRAQDRVNADRRRLPVVRIDKPYRFEGPNGTVGLLDLFEGRPQLVMHHFMWIYDIDANGAEHPRDTGCPWLLLGRRWNRQTEAAGRPWHHAGRSVAAAVRQDRRLP